MDFGKWASENLIVKAVAGSRLYGTHNESSDYDYRGVCLDPPESLLGIQQFGQYENVTKTHDEVIYGASKFIRLCLDANPSILDVLFAPDESLMVATPLWRKIQAASKWLLSQKVRHTFSGYAYSQLKRIKRHKVWIDSPPAEPSLEEYGLYLHSTPSGGQRYEPIPIARDLWTERFPYVDIDAVKKTIRSRSMLVPQDKTAMVASYRAAKAEYDKYNEWKRNRNPERAALEEKYGYDVKHASHLVRLLLQGENILRDCNYNPRLTGETRRMVTAVLRGEWDYYRLTSFAEEQEKKVKTMDTDLRHGPDLKVANGLLRIAAAESLMKDEWIMRLLTSRR